LSVGEVPTDKKVLSRKNFWPEAWEFMENRHLPILHENIPLSVLRVPNEPLPSWGEWVVKIVLNVNYPLLQAITHPFP
jgi:hypothetical protein